MDAPPVDELVFGTDGWRDIIADRFTFGNVARCAQAYAEHLLERGQELAVVGFDTRFGGDRFARVAAEVLSANGVTALLSATFAPTPAVSYAVRHFGAGGAIMLTASHNPPHWHGLKIKGPYGGTATEAIYRDVAARVRRTGTDDVRRGAAGGAPIEVVDLRAPYFTGLRELVDTEALARLEGTVVHDSMGGAASGWLSGFIRFAGLPLEVEALRKRPDPLFYGVNPEPLPHNLAPAVQRAQQGDLHFVAATDGDGDRLGLVLPGGGFFNSHQIFAVLLDLLSRRGGSGSVVKTFTVSRIIEKLAQARGLPVVETPVGFKHIVDAMLTGDVLIGGEESGGIGVSGHIPERDGIANTLLLLEALALSGEGPGEIFARLEREVGFSHSYDRVDLELENRRLLDGVMARLAEQPGDLAGRSVTGQESRDGVKLNFADGGWVLFRASGTEPLLRIYAESATPGEVTALLQAAQEFVAAAAG